MIIGAHSIIYSTNAEADRVFLRDVLGLNHVDVGEGWLIFGLPPAEVAVHPSSNNDVHEFYLMCDDVHGLVEEMQLHGISCAAVEDLGWGVRTHVMLPGGGQLGIYQPRHARPKTMGLKTATRRARKRVARHASKPKARKSRAQRPEEIARESGRSYPRDSAARNRAAST